MEETNEYRDELITLILDGGKAATGQKTIRFDGFEPIERFVSLSQAVAKFGMVLSLGAGALGLAVIGANRITGANKLLTVDIGETFPRQSLEDARDSATESKGASAQIAFFMEHGFGKSISLSALQLFSHWRLPSIRRRRS
ncbi:MAG TPA: hypothetical protein VMC06_11420 [Opitutaceae bacterium]|nr:hypothetical protein [Opitutaceae bacterium]